MEQLKYDFDTLRAAFDIFAARFDKHIASVAEQAANTTLPAPVSILEQAKAKAREDIEARIKEKVAQLTAPKMVAKPQFPMMYAARTPGQMYLDRVHEEQRRLEAERYVRRQMNKKTKFQRACEAIRFQYPSLSVAEVYAAARYQLSSKTGMAHFGRTQIPAPAKTKFQLACDAVRGQFPNMPTNEVYIAARMRLKLKAHANQIPILAAEGAANLNM